ncbi:MAG TPA: hypothetical protein VD864_10425 [Nocardioides sp.]|nr:hypothetical protein [Nocardioides sp.]
MRPRRRPFPTAVSPRLARAIVATVATAVLALSAGCGGSDDGPSAPAAAAGADASEASGEVPEECADLYPFAMDTPDLEQVALLPDGFPEPPVDATLCETGGAGDGQEYAAYASTASSEEVLTAYEAALAAYGAARAEDGLGNPVVTASVGDVAVQVSTKEGGFRLVLTRDCSQRRAPCGG